MERTLVIIKPDGVQKRLIGEIVYRLSKEELRIADIKIEKLTKRQAYELYKESIKKFPKIKDAIINYMIESPSVLLILEEKDAIKKARKIRGFSDPSKSPKGSVRRDYAGNQKMEELTRKGKVTKNIMHASGSKEEAKKEIKLLFGLK